MSLLSCSFFTLNFFIKNPAGAEPQVQQNQNFRVPSVK